MMTDSNDANGSLFAGLHMSQTSSENSADDNIREQADHATTTTGSSGASSTDRTPKQSNKSKVVDHGAQQPQQHLPDAPLVMMTTTSSDDNDHLLGNLVVVTPASPVGVAPRPDMVATVESKEESSDVVMAASSESSEKASMVLSEIDSREESEVIDAGNDSVPPANAAANDTVPETATLDTDAAVTNTTTTTTTTTDAETVGGADGGGASSSSVITSESVVVVVTHDDAPAAGRDEQPVAAAAAVAAAAEGSSSSYGSYFSSWWSSGSDTKGPEADVGAVAPPPPPPAPPAAVAGETAPAAEGAVNNEKPDGPRSDRPETVVAEAPSDAEHAMTTAVPSTVAAGAAASDDGKPAAADAELSLESTAAAAVPAEGIEEPPAAAAAAAAPGAPDEVVINHEDKEQEQAVAAAAAAAAAASSPQRKEMTAQEQRALDEAFDKAGGGDTDRMEEHDNQPRPRGLGKIHPDTPVPHSDTCLRLLRNFAHKTRPKIITTYGGSKSRTLFGILFGTKEDPTFVPYRELLDVLYDPGEDRDMKDDSEVEGMVLGADGDTMGRARLALAGFCYVFSQWGHASSWFFERKDVKSQQAFSELMAVSLDTASQLVAHGCTDNVLLGLGPGQREYHPLVHMLAQSVFNSDLTIERNELSAMKLLLSMGCRVIPDGGSLLRGSHLLQTIRTLYHIYLTTESQPNKTTARAALRQITSSVFARVVRSDEDGATGAATTEPTDDKFPSENHRDAFLVLRSICKLSMRNMPDPKTGLHSHIGLLASGSNDTWEGYREESPQKQDSADKPKLSSHHQEHAQLVFTSAIHPALESKILALDLLYYVLENTTFSKGFIQRSGSQFHAAIRNYLCVSLLKNCTSDTTQVVNLSLRIFVPLVRYFRSILKNEIEAFVTNVFFVILDSKNSSIEHKSIVVSTFDEICSDPKTLAEIFLNYDCDLSAVDLFHRIVNTLSKVSRTGLQEPKTTGLGFMGGSSAARMEKFRNENRDLRLSAMRALRQVLASLHASIVEPMRTEKELGRLESMPSEDGSLSAGGEGEEKHNPVEMYGSKKKLRAEEAEVVHKFNQKPAAGIAHAAKCGHLDGEDPVDVAKYLLANQNMLDKTQIGEYLGREPDYQNGFSLKVLHEYVRLMDLTGLVFDDAIRFFLSGFRLPGEAQKIDRIMEKFAERFTELNPDVFPTADVAFILAFSIIMLNTDLHNPAIKEERRMTKEGFIRNNRGICDGHDLPEDLLFSIFDRIKTNPISLKEDDDARERARDGKGGKGSTSALYPTSFFSSHYDDMDRARESNFQKEKVHIVRTTESILKSRRHSSDPMSRKPSQRSGKLQSRSSTRFVRTEDSGLCDEYVSPMFDVTWGPALAAFSTALESANGTDRGLISIASDEELELAAENAAETIEVCLTGFRFAVCTAGLCGNAVARDAYMLALGRFTQLGTGALLEPRHARCVQTMLSLAREDGELLGSTWEHVFKALSEINRFHQLFQLMARNDRAAARAADRRRRRMKEKERRKAEQDRRRAAAEDGESVDEGDETPDESDLDSLAESDMFSDDDYVFETMDAKAIDEANARSVYDAVSEATIEAIYERSSSLSAPAVMDFMTQLCYVSRMETSVGIHRANGGKSDLTQVTYRQQHALLGSSVASNGAAKDQFHHTQPNIYSLQKLVEATHYNMDSRPRMIFADLWSIVADHLVATALHENPALAMYAVDSFRQLSIQYLQREELEVFEFQRRFLKPIEAVMSRSALMSTKELLLNCIDRIIHVFAVDGSNANLAVKGGLRSGWIPILEILGLGGCDIDYNIAAASYRTLSRCIKDCTASTDRTGVLLNEHFIETVDALFEFVGGPHDEMSLRAIRQLVSLTDFLGDDRVATPQSKRHSAHDAEHADGQHDYELWWPIMLGLSKSVGDSRGDIRAKALECLFAIIERHFVPSHPAGDSANAIQTLQLIFRGILTPILECAETDGGESHVPGLPTDFTRFLTTPKPAKSSNAEAVEDVACNGWTETTFDPYIDACVSLCLKAISSCGSDMLIEEILAILNSSLASDSGVLAVRGLRRLEQFLTSDLELGMVTDDIWATVSHMLRRSIAVRGIPVKPKHAEAVSGEEDSAAKEAQDEYAADCREFASEDIALPDRRYLLSNAIAFIGLLLCTERYSDAIGFRWRLFFMTGLGRSIAEYDDAASIVQDATRKIDESAVRPPAYEETSVYARTWMNRFVLQLASIPDVVAAPPDGDKNDYLVVAQKLIMYETQRLLDGFLDAERVGTQYRHTEGEEALYKQYMKLTAELLNGFNHMESEHLDKLQWINPVLLTSCIQTKNEDVRGMVQKLIQRTSGVPQSPPSAVETPAPVEDVSSAPDLLRQEDGPLQADADGGIAGDCGVANAGADVQDDYDDADEMAAANGHGSFAGEELLDSRQAPVKTDAQGVPALAADLDEDPAPLQEA